MIRPRAIRPGDLVQPYGVTLQVLSVRGFAVPRVRVQRRPAP